MTTLHIIIMGLIALVPTHDQNGNEGLNIVVPQAEGHVPVIIFPTAAGTYLTETFEAACALDLLGNLKNGLLDNGCKGCGAIELKKKTITIKGLTAGSLKFAGGRHERLGDLIGAVPRTSIEAHDFSWLPQMDKLAGRHAPLKKYYCDPDYAGEERKGLLILEKIKGSVWTSHMAEIFEPLDGCHGSEQVGTGNFPIPGGGITDEKGLGYTTEIADDEGDFVVRPLSFLHNGFPIGSPRQAVADEVTIDLPLTTNYVTIKLSGYSDIVLKPQAQGGDIDLLIGNLTPLARYGPAGNCPPELVNTWPLRERDMKCRIEVGHYRHYYDMADGAGGIQKIGFGVDCRRILGKKVNRSVAPGVVDAVSKPKKGGGDHGGVGRPLCTPLGYGG